MLDASQKRRAWKSDVNYRDLFVGLVKVPSLSIISESGLYKLVMRSDKPEAKEFQNWVTRVVLPAIRKDGGYIHGEEHVVSGAMTEVSLFKFKDHNVRVVIIRGNRGGWLRMCAGRSATR